jgi:hypothetical protein
MSNLVYSTAIGTTVRNSFNAWAEHIKIRTEAKAKAKKWKKKFILTPEDQQKGNGLFIKFTTACENEDKDFKAVAEILRNEA